MLVMIYHGTVAKQSTRLTLEKGAPQNIQVANNKVPYVGMILEF